MHLVLDATVGHSRSAAQLCSSYFEVQEKRQFNLYLLSFKVTWQVYEMYTVTHRTC